MKNSARGLLRVSEQGYLSEEVSPAEADTGLLRIVFRNGMLFNEQTLAEIRARLAAQR